MKIELENLGKTFGERVVLQGLSYSEEVHSLAIIGPSGGGKSTLLRMLGGLLAPTAGEILIDGKRVVFEEKALRNYRRSIGFVFQANGLFEHLTALENVTLPLIHTYGMTKTTAEERAKELFQRFGLAKEKGKYPVQLSGGQQQRIAIARAMAINPKLLLLDEPTSALDPEYTVEVLDMLKDLQNEGLSTILVTHEMGFAKNACEKALFLADHRILESGYSAEMFKSPQSSQLQSFLHKVLEWSI